MSLTNLITAFLLSHLLRGLESSPDLASGALVSRAAPAPPILPAALSSLAALFLLSSIKISLKISLSKASCFFSLESSFSILRKKVFYLKSNLSIFAFSTLIRRKKIIATNQFYDSLFYFVLST